MITMLLGNLITSTPEDKPLINSVEREQKVNKSFKINNQTNKKQMTV